MNHSGPIGSKNPAKMLALAVVALAMAPAGAIANTTAPHGAERLPETVGVQSVAGQASSGTGSPRAWAASRSMR